MFSIAIVCLVLLVHAGLSVSDELNRTNNVKCVPIPSVVPVKEEGLPYFVILYRCQGSVDFHSPSTRKCVSNTTNTVAVNVDGFKSKRVYMKNDTSCKGECVYHEDCKAELFERNEKECKCGKCKFNEAPKGCRTDFSWNAQSCKCECSLQAPNPRGRKRLDQDQCKLICKKKRDCTKIGPGYTYDEDKCRCRRNALTVEGRKGSDNSQGKLIAALMVGEFVVLFFIFGFVYYIKYKYSPNKPEEPSQEENANGHNGTLLPMRVGSNGTPLVPRSKTYESSL